MKHSADKDVNRLTRINNNCLLFYEWIDLEEIRNYIEEEGSENIYCFDFTTNSLVLFNNKPLNYYISDVIPIRIDGIVKIKSYEWYPAGDWIKIYDSI